MTPPSRAQTLKLSVSANLQTQESSLFGGGLSLEALPRLSDSVQLKLGAGYDQNFVFAQPGIDILNNSTVIRDSDSSLYPHITFGIQKTLGPSLHFFAQQSVGPWILEGEKINATSSPSSRSVTIEKDTTVAVGLKTTVGLDISLSHAFGLRFGLNTHLGLGDLPVGIRSWGFGGQGGAFISF